MGYTLPDKTAHDWFDQLKTPFDQIWDDIQSAGTGTAKVRVGTRAERLAYAAPSAGLSWIETDKNADNQWRWQHDGSAWLAVGGNISAFMALMLLVESAAAARTALDVPSSGEVSASLQAVAALILSAGIQSGLGIKYKDSDEVTLDDGEIEIGGSVYSFNGADFDVAASFGGALTASTWHFLYLNPAGASAGALGTTDIVVETAVPTWDAAKNGWYHPTEATYRCPFELGWAVLADGSSNIVLFIVAGGIYSHAPLTLLDDITPATSATALPTNVPGAGTWTIMGEFRVGHSTTTGVAGYVFNGLGSPAIWLFPNVASGGSLNSSIFIAATDASRQIMFSGSPTTFATFKIFQTGFFLPPRP
ncbi:MAG: hypothetical protein K9K65_11490 [Desulfarculaceae bacterium]|nr:hypothetical protein [Desulfarculaceae bacterium]MCF8048370.1 hypothetical protein [Desulfarculaceae bacterium]MCF8098457.1 hypothetical protein [Desulfarculaceae bacterium]MCF8123898.1 hypothetical protein [Desulfarculaceae bacterium]